MRTQHRTRYAVALVAASAVLLAGCGGDGDDGDDSSPGVVVTVDAADAANNVPVPERQFFNDSSPWNQRIDTVRVDPNSDQMIEAAHYRVGVEERTSGESYAREIRIDGGLFINTTRWTVPVVSGGSPTSLVCRQLVCGDGANTTVLNIPDDVDPDPRFDGWYTVFDTASSTAYDLWRARRENDDTISYNYMRKWDLNGPGFSEPYHEGARGSGLPLFAGLIRPGELESGEIKHALAISLPGPAQGSFVQPASSTDGNGRVTSIPEGARIRLKRDVVLPPPIDPLTGKVIKLTKLQQRLADAIVACLRTYGAIVVDRAAVPTLYAQRDVTGNLIRGNELQGLVLGDFEVLPLGHKYPYPPDRETIQLIEAGIDPSDSSSSTASPSGSPSESPSASDSAGAVQ